MHMHDQFLLADFCSGDNIFSTVDIISFMVFMQATGPTNSRRAKDRKEKNEFREHSQNVTFRVCPLTHYARYPIIHVHMQILHRHSPRSLGGIQTEARRTTATLKFIQGNVK